VADGTRALARAAKVYAALVGGLVLVWALTSAGYFWPVWPAIVLGTPLAAWAWLVLVDVRPELFAERKIPAEIARVGGVWAVGSAFFVSVWAVTSRGYFWPAWPILVAGGVVALVMTRSRGQADERIAVLETSRAGAVNQQEAELRRIERDLHDGAQARLVALGISLGMAEQKLASDPAAAREHLEDARRGTQEALEELRRLARGIHPPVLTDRGLGAAVSALADRTPLAVSVDVDLPERPPAAVETAAYFVVAESLANAGKHGDAKRVDIAIREERGALEVRIVDDGVGGADPSGSGLTGLAQRVGALDGTLRVRSPEGGPTTVEAVIPCAS
jgi:signal transduction histidine kinase